MSQGEEPVTVVIIESTRCLKAENLDVDTATTVVALISEDPSNWEEAMSVWPRYRSPAVCEFVSNLPFTPTDRKQVAHILDSSNAWVVIDFQTKRLLTFGKSMQFGRNAAFTMIAQNSDEQLPLDVHLPPWWELHEGSTPELVNRPRQSTMNRPCVDRKILYGKVFLTNIAKRILDVVSREAWQNNGTGNSHRARYPFTVSVHREWLMTPLEELNGRIPRELLHGAIEWIESVTSGQRIRFEEGGPMVAAPNDWAGFDTAPMGSQEMCLYFDLCRILIDAGWTWCESEDGKAARKNNEVALTQLIQFLSDAKDEWMTSSYEGDSSPEFILECDRRRVPCGDGVEIEGIDQVESEPHVANCDCPICEMMDDGMFGIGFSSFDGHQLELDDEFAFSMKETREEWEEQQQEFGAFDDEMDEQQAESEAECDNEDPFTPVWTGIKDTSDLPEDSPLSGKRTSHWMMAFMVAEVVSKLENLSETRDEIKSLNECFANFRLSDDDQRPQRAAELKTNLQSLAKRYPPLVSRSADLQSRIDEALRSSEFNDSEFGSAF